MSSYSVQVENLIDEIGGCGLLQALLCISIHSSRTIIYWSSLAMSFIGYTPDFSCKVLDVDQASLSALNLSDISPHQLCSSGPNTICSSYEFNQSMNTVVSEWDLVCDRRWMIAFITSSQMVGLLIGSLIAGQMADCFGRKPTIISGITLLTVFNFLGYLSQSWITYSAVRFFIGIGVGLSSTAQYTYMIEFVPSSWRPIVVCFPSSSMVAVIFALVSWWSHNWRSLHLLKTLIGIIFFIIIWFLPESFRWLSTKMKYDRARKSVEIIASVNRRRIPNVKELFITAETEGKSDVSVQWTFLKLLTSKELRKITLPLAMLWFAVCTSWYGLTLGMETFSVDIYFAICLVNIVDIPAQLVSVVCITRYGRKRSCLAFFCLSGIICCGSGILQNFDKVLNSSSWLKVSTCAMSLLAKFAVSSADQCVVIYTMELYPTIIRTMGFSFQATVGRTGAILAPFLIHIDAHLPGAMYFICGVLLLLSSAFVYFLTETKDKVLQDYIKPDMSE